MKIQGNYDLTELNTFGVAVRAKFFAEVLNETDLRELLEGSEFRNNRKIFLGGGSNVLFTKDFDGLVVLNKLKGIEVLSASTESVGKDFVYIRAMGGEVWHDLVIFAVERRLWGIENLALIPGTVGAAPIQNIGAYGAELRQVLENVEAYDVQTGEKRIFNKEECELGYRDSVFKNKLKGRYFISAITLKLSKKEKKNLAYKALADFLKKNAIEVGEPKDVSDAVSEIRKSKLPDPNIIPNAGSFFKNVFLARRSEGEGGVKNKLEELSEKYPGMPYFEEDGVVKIPAGWLIEQCGWRGKRIGNVGVHERQALVLVNHGGASGEEVLFLANKIMASVKEKFGLDLVPEVNLV